MIYSFEKNFEINEIESARIAKELCLPFDLTEDYLTLEIEYNYTQAFPGNWDNPSEPSQIVIVNVSVIKVPIPGLNLDQFKKLDELLFGMKEEEIETACFEDAERQSDAPLFFHEDIDY
jgi:hypothetical protein